MAALSSFGYGVLGLNILLSLIFLSACITAIILTNQNYNTSTANADWILVGALTPNSANFRIRLLEQNNDNDEDDEEEERRFVVSTIPLEQVYYSSSSSNEQQQPPPPALNDVLIWDEGLPTIVKNNNGNNNNNNNTNMGWTTYVQSITVESLESNTRYYYGIIVSAAAAAASSSSFTTNNNSNNNNGQGFHRLIRSGQFRTAPAIGQRTNFSFVAGGCAMTGSQHKVFETIAATTTTTTTNHHDSKNVLFFLHLGDFHYLDLNTNDLKQRIQGIDQTLLSSTQAKLFSQMAFVGMWDDHDWLGNDSLGYNSPGRETALESYKQAFPHPQPLPSESSSSSTSSLNRTGGVYHAFTIGTVRFVLSDLRSERTLSSIYSKEQKQWLLNELSQSNQYDFIIWITPSPWIGMVDLDQDNWMSVPQDRRDLSTFISSSSSNSTLRLTQNLLAISADAHMVAFDDGSNTFYGHVQDENDDDDKNKNNGTTTTTTPQRPSFPILQTGPLDRLGSVKGGPYSHGCTAYKYERNHQYSIISFTTDTDTTTPTTGSNTKQEEDGNNDKEPCLEIRSYRWLEGQRDSTQEILNQRLCGKIFNTIKENTTTTTTTTGTDVNAAATTTTTTVGGSCEEPIPLFSSTNKALLISAACVLVLVFVASCCLVRQLQQQQEDEDEEDILIRRWYCHVLILSMIVVIWFGPTLVAGICIPMAMGYPQFDTYPILIIGLLLVGCAFLYILGWMYLIRRRRQQQQVKQRYTI